VKKLILLTLPLFFFACNSIEKYRGPIEELANNWTETTNEVTNFSNLLSTFVSDANNNLSALSFPEDQAGTIAGAEKFEAMKSGVAKALEGFNPIQNELAQTMSTWTEKTAALKGLTEGLASNKLDGNVSATIEDLQGTLTQVNDLIPTWKTQFETQRDGVNRSLEQLNTIYSAMTEK
jgi:flagellar biosynthesis chaperone FliJ